MAWTKIRAAEKLLKAGDYENALYMVGYSVEFTLKARICVDQKLSGWPQSDVEWKQIDKNKFKVHDFNRLLALTSMESHIKANFLADWGRCNQWDVSSRYQPMQTVTESSVDALMQSAEAIVREISAKPGMEAKIISASDHPYIKLTGLERELAIEKGPFSLFAIWHRTGSHNSADLVVSARWLNANSRNEAKYIQERVSRVLTGEEMKTLSGLFVLDPDHQVVHALTMEMPRSFFKNCEIQNSNFAGIHIDKAYIVAANVLGSHES